MPSFNYLESLHGYSLWNGAGKIFVQGPDGSDLEPECVFDNVHEANNAIEAAFHGSRRRHNNAYVWLQPDEEEGTADCGCRLINDEEGARFLMCPTHAAAVQLAEACRSVVESLATSDLQFAARKCQAAVDKVDSPTFSERGK